MWFHTKWVVLWSLWAARLVRQPTPPLRVSSGELRGSVSPSGTYAQYLNIPYGTFRRFQAPGPAPVWDSTFEAVNENVQCTQSGFFGKGSAVSGRDDCLILNVYTPLEKPSSSYLPVMVFIHGGGFFTGSSSKMIYGPEYLTDKGVILVTINYRLNVQGFLSLGIKEAPGNAGMKDQVAALKWVQQNIRVFGGDPDNVTIFGESAGGASVSYHLLSPMSKGLFHKAIIQSGSSLTSWAFQHDPIEAALIKAKAIGYTGQTADPHDLYNFYASKTAHEHLSLKPPRKEGDIVISELLFTPCIEKVFDGVEPFLTESPYTILSEGRFNNVPLIIGANSGEGILFAAIETADLQTIKIETALPKNLIFQSVDELKTIADDIQKIYMGDDKISDDSIEKFFKYLGEPFFNYHIAEETILAVKTNDKPVYYYFFEYDGWRNIAKLLIANHLRHLKGASHADELFYLFSQLPSMFEDRMIQRMTTMWTNFAKYGDPTPAVTELLPVKWPAVTIEDQSALIINQEFSIGRIWQEDRLLFWKEVYAKYRRK